MKKVTVADCLELQKLFEKYCETAEQHEFIKLALIQSHMDKYISRLQLVGKIENQNEANAMFRVVLGAIGKDFSDYKEEEMNKEYCEFCFGGKALVIDKRNDVGIAIRYPNQLIAYGYDIYGLYGLDSNSITIKINYCPMCGRRLMDRK